MTEYYAKRADAGLIISKATLIDSIEYDDLQGKPSQFMHKNYKGTFVTCGSYTVDSARQAIANKKSDLVALGRSFIANADLINQIQSEVELQEYDVAMLKSL